MRSEKQRELIVEYEWLREWARQLDVQAEHVDRRLIEMERHLPDRYTFPGDLPPSRTIFPRFKNH
jgi:hypothetical protein